MIPSTNKPDDEPRPHIVVVGSINMDLVVRVERLPRAGETVSGSEWLQIPGGKGANQAVAAARLGGRSTLIGRVGDDGFGRQLLAALAGYGVDVSHVLTTEGCSSGVALIGVEKGGDNAITIVSGANGRLTPEDVHKWESIIAAADAVICQLEVPLATVEAAILTARRHGVLSVLDPAPVPSQGMPASFFEADIVTPNQTEAEQLTGVAVVGPDDAVRAAERLQQRGARRVVIKLGQQGALLRDGRSRVQHVPATRVEVVDTTAAGDAFTAAMTLGCVEGLDLVESVRFGCAAGTLATTKLGAQQAMPTRAAIERFMRSDR